MFGGDMMRDLMVGSGWLGLLACMVLGGIARLPLAAAGTRRAEGRPWAVQGVLGFGLLGLALLAALSALGSFFGFMGIAFAAFMAVGGVQAFTAGERARRRRQAEVDHAARLGKAFRGPTGAGSGPGPEGAPPADPSPAWYPREDGDERRG